MPNTARGCAANVGFPDQQVPEAPARLDPSARASA